MGGKSSEHEISIISGREVVLNLDINKYDVIPVVISKDGHNWHLTDKDSLLRLKNITSLKNSPKDISLLVKRTYKIPTDYKQKSKTIVFIAMHGLYGEDGTVQGMFDLMGLAYTGSGVLASSVGMDKDIFRTLLISGRILVPNYFVLTKEEEIKNRLSFPVFVKPVRGGSSVGSSIARNFREYRKSVKDAFKYDSRIMVDEYIRGKEITCGILGNRKPIALPLIEIKPLKGKFFNYESKYSESGAEEIVPANLPKKLTQQIQQISLKVYKLLGMRGFGRVDLLIKDNNFPVVLEVNTIPGLTPVSLLPKAAQAYGLSYSQLLDKIIEYANES